jgi:hypothetical protein
MTPQHPEREEEGRTDEEIPERRDGGQVQPTEGFDENGHP